ncbi:hypothetical protein PO124_11335 [Bacillus licheniformis]|nr:hypothetical protein [Bacillus licheniformis]
MMNSHWKPLIERKTPIFPIIYHKRIVIANEGISRSETAHSREDVKAL